jgi:hypothetical protein
MDAQVLLINLNDIRRLTSISGNIDSDKLIPHILNAKNIELVRILGGNLFNKLIELVDKNEMDLPINKKYKDLLDNYVRSVLVFYTMEFFLPFHQYTIANAGVNKIYGDNNEIVDRSEIDFLTQKYRNLADEYAHKLDDYLCCGDGVGLAESCSSDGCTEPKKPAKYRVGLYLG